MSSYQFGKLQKQNNELRVQLAQYRNLGTLEELVRAKAFYDRYYDSVCILLKEVEDGQCEGQSEVSSTETSGD